MVTRLLFIGLSLSFASDCVTAGMLQTYDASALLRSDSECAGSELTSLAPRTPTIVQGEGLDCRWSVGRIADSLAGGTTSQTIPVPIYSSGGIVTFPSNSERACFIKISPHPTSPFIDGPLKPPQ